MMENIVVFNWELDFIWGFCVILCLYYCYYYKICEMLEEEKEVFVEKGICVEVVK